MKRLATKHTFLNFTTWVTTLRLWGGRRLTVAIGRDGWRPFLRCRVWTLPTARQRVEPRASAVETDLECRRRHA